MLLYIATCFEIQVCWKLQMRRIPSERPITFNGQRYHECTTSLRSPHLFPFRCTTKRFEIQIYRKSLIHQMTSVARITMNTLNIYIPGGPNWCFVSRPAHLKIFHIIFKFSLCPPVLISEHRTHTTLAEIMIYLENKMRRQLLKENMMSIYM